MTKRLGYAEVMAQHRKLVADAPPFKHNRSPKRIPLDTEPKGPWMANGGMNREMHDPFRTKRKV